MSYPRYRLYELINKGISAIALSGFIEHASPAYLLFGSFKTKTPPVFSPEGEFDFSYM
jgi:hypothetical protein